MSPLPLKWKLSILITTAATVIIIVLSAVAYIEFQEALIRHIDYTLKGLGEGVYAILNEENTPEQKQMEIAAILGGATHRQNFRYRVWFENSSETIVIHDPPLTGNAPLFGDDFLSRPPGVGKSFFFTTADKNFRVYWKRQEVDQTIVNILIADTTGYTKHEAGEFLRLLLILGGCVVGVSIVVIFLSISWALRPIRITASVLHTVTHANLGDEPLKELRPPRELKPFVESVTQMLARLNQAMQKQKQFTEDASHELRTPLALAKSMLQTVRRKDRPSEEYIQAIDDTLKDIDRMEKLSNQLLDLARIDHAERRAVMESVRLDELLQDLTDRYREASQSSGKIIVCQTIPGIFILGHRELLEQLFSNLLDNALKYGPTGRPIQIRVLEEGHQIMICVHDEGGSIPPEAREKLFDRFYRLDASCSSVTGGTGLGLSIAREIARLHQGDIEIQSSPASGTDVILHLPRIPG